MQSIRFSGVTLYQRNYPKTEVLPKMPTEASQMGTGHWQQVEDAMQQWQQQVKQVEQNNAKTIGKASQQLSTRVEKEIKALVAKHGKDSDYRATAFPVTVPHKMAALLVDGQDLKNLVWDMHKTKQRNLQPLWEDAKELDERGHCSREAPLSEAALRELTPKKGLNWARVFHHFDPATNMGKAKYEVLQNYVKKAKIINIEV